MTTRFVAFGVAPTVRVALDAAIAPLRPRRSGLAWTDPLGWHVTLAFLGRLPDSVVPTVTEALDAAVGATGLDQGAFPRLTLGRVTSFGARVLVVAVEDDPAGSVAALGVRVQANMADAGLPVHERDVRPHLTLARARRGSGVDPSVVAETQRTLDALPAAGSWQPRAVGVYSSHPRPDRRARYVVDAEVPEVS